MSTIVRDAGRGVVRSLVIQLVSLVIGLPLGLFWVFTTIALVIATDFHPVALFVVGLMWVGPFALLLAVQVGVVMWRARTLDRLFVPLGLEGRAYMTHFRRYLGEVSGRQVDVRLWRGPVLELEIATTLDTRLGVTEHQADTSFFADLVGKRPLDLAHPDLSDHTVFAMDETWTRALLSEESTRAAIRRLTALGSTVFTRQQLLLRPGAMSVMLTGNRRLFGVDITPEQARQWMDDLLVVVEAAEALPAPTQTDKLSSSEVFALRLRDRNPYMALWAGLAIFGFFVVAAVVIFGGVFLFTALNGH